MKILAFVISCDEFLHACTVKSAVTPMNQSLTVFFNSSAVPMCVQPKKCFKCVNN